MLWPNFFALLTLVSYVLAKPLALKHSHGHHIDHARLQRRLAGTSTYTVVAGDTGNAIAAAYSITFATLNASNTNVDWNSLQIGQSLSMPSNRVPIAYTTVSGDSSTIIAARFDIITADLATANPSVTWASLQPGTNLRIPGYGSCSTYTVASGDYGYLIASAYSITFDSLSAANPNINWNTLQVGQVLTIPAGTSPSSGSLPSATACAASSATTTTTSATTNARSAASMTTSTSKSYASATTSTSTTMSDTPIATSNVSWATYTTAASTTSSSPTSTTLARGSAASGTTLSTTTTSTTKATTTSTSTLLTSSLTTRTSTATTSPVLSSTSTASVTTTIISSQSTSKTTTVTSSTTTTKSTSTSTPTTTTSSTSKTSTPVTTTTTTALTSTTTSRTSTITTTLKTSTTTTMLTSTTTPSSSSSSKTSTTTTTTTSPSTTSTTTSLTSTSASGAFPTVSGANYVTGGNNNDGVASRADTYTFYQGDGSTSAGWPAKSQWISFSTMWKNFSPNLGQSCQSIFGSTVINNSASENQTIYDNIQTIATQSGVDHRFILAIIIQESSACVRVPTTYGSVSNPGLMQDYNGSGSCNSNGVVQNPCPASEITQMIQDGTFGTSSDGGKTYVAGLVQDINASPTYSDAQVIYRAARIYNSGSVPSSNDLGAAGATRCYASDIANRLMGWVYATRTCTLS